MATAAVASSSQALTTTANIDRRRTSTASEVQRNPMNLLFIVRSGNSSVKTEEDRRQINRRAQQNAHLKKQQARQRKLLTTVPTKQLTRIVARREAEAAEEETTSKSKLTALALTKPTENTDDIHATSLQNVLDSRSLDPFSSGKVPITPHMESIFMHYANVLLPVIEPIQAERDEFHQWLVPMTLTEPALLYALTACFAYDIEMGSAYGFGPTARKSWTTERVMYRIKAIQALNECLADETNAMKPSTLLAVHYLLWHEVRSSKRGERS